VLRLERRGGAAVWALWHVAVLGALITIPAHLRLGPVWELDPSLTPFMVGMAATYAAAAAALFVTTRGGRRLPLGAALWCAVVPMAAFFLGILVLAEQYPRSILILFTLVGPVALLVSVSAGPLLLSLGSAPLGVATLVAIAAGFLVEEATSVERRVVPSSVFSLEMTFYHGYFGPVGATGGAVERLDSGYLVALADGRLWSATLDNKSMALTAVDLEHSVPMDREAFLTAAEARGNVDTRWFRTNDVLTRRVGDRVQLFASHHHWDEANGCATTRVSLTETDAGGDFSKAGPWVTVFDATPCLAFKDRGHPFAGHFSGGKLAFLDENSLLLTTGDHEFDGFSSDYLIAQDDSASYGKTILIDLASGTSRVFSKGHRNPQGLFVDSEGTIWLTEQGPRGGDELNRVVEGANYGWPLVTYGSEYSLPAWPLSLTPGRHDGYEAPVFSWTPSIAVSALGGFEGGVFDFWKGDLIAGSLGNRALWRLRFDGNRVALAERIPVDERIRDFAFGLDGELVLLTEGFDGVGPPVPALVVVRPVLDEGADMSESERGAFLFAQCSGCHPTDPEHGHGIGPDLGGVFGRGGAATAGVGVYEGLTRLGGSWTEARLDGFIEDPRGFAPGTAMDFVGIGDPADRAALLGYLRTLSSQPHEARPVREVQ
jgi:cytochrome c2